MEKESGDDSRHANLCHFARNTGRVTVISKVVNCVHCVDLHPNPDTELVLATHIVPRLFDSRHIAMLPMASVAGIAGIVVYPQITHRASSENNSRKSTGNECVKDGFCVAAH